MEGNYKKYISWRRVTTNFNNAQDQTTTASALLHIPKHLDSAVSGDHAESPEEITELSLSKELHEDFM